MIRPIALTLGLVAVAVLLLFGEYGPMYLPGFQHYAEAKNLGLFLSWVTIVAILSVSGLAHKLETEGEKPFFVVSPHGWRANIWMLIVLVIILASKENYVTAALMLIATTMLMSSYLEYRQTELSDEVNGLERQLGELNKGNLDKGR